MAHLTPGNSQPSLPPAVLAAEQRAREFLAQEKWRKARDELKPLVKGDRARFLPLLIQANIGLSREMMAKGQVSEAQQVLDYLATIAPTEQLRAVELELASRSGVADAALPRFVAALADTSAPVPENERVRLADALLLTFQPAQGDGPAQQQIASEARAIQDALLAVSQGQWVQASEALRVIPRRSAFSHWVLFIKGIAAFHSGETDRMEKLFAALPPESATAKAAQPYLLLSDRLPPTKDGKPPPAAVIEGACRLTGTPALGSLLLKADRAWKERRHVDSYRVFRDSMKSFPSHGLDWLGALSEFYFHAPQGMSEKERSAYMGYLDEIISRRQFKSGAEEMWIRRMFALLDGAIMPAQQLRFDWETFLRHYQALRGENPRLASLAYGWLGERLSMVRVTPAYFAPRQPQIRDTRGAVEMLQKSIQLDSGNLAAHLQLCAVYDALKRTSERNRLLDDMSARFPDDKKVMLRAAQGCLERKAFVKGLDYLTRTRQLDPLDPQIPELLASAQRSLARQYFQQGKPQKARQTLARIEEFLTDKPDDLQRSRWTAVLRQGVMELVWGDAELSGTQLAQARAAAPRADVYLLFAHMAHRVYTNTRRCHSPFWAELKATKGAVSSVGGVAWLLRVLVYWKQTSESPQVYEEERLVRDLLKAALRQPFTRAEALEVMELVQDNFVFEEQVRGLVKKLLRDDRLDPRVRLFQLGMSGDWEFNHMGNRTKLQSILDEAMRRQDDATVRKARQMLQELDRPPLVPGPFGPDFGGPDDDDEDWEDDQDMEGLLPPDLPPAKLAEFSEMLEALKAAPDSLIRTLRKTRPPDIPEALFDALVQIAKGGPPPSLPPHPLPPPSAPRKPAPPPRDPNQIDLL